MKAAWADVSTRERQRFERVDRPRDSICHSCRAPVKWVRFSDGIDRPVQPCAEGTGNVVFQENLLGGRPTAVLERSKRSGWELHIRTCPDAQEWRAKMIRRKAKG